MKRVLIIDDSEAEAFILSQLLQALGHSTESVMNVGAAKSRLQVFAPNVVICGKSLQETDQRDIVASCRQCSNSHVTLVGVRSPGCRTANNQPVPAGFDDLLTQPIDVMQLVDLMMDPMNVQKQEVEDGKVCCCSSAHTISSLK